MANSKNELTVSNIRYLLVMYDLCEGGTGTRCVRIAEALGLSKPSVHAMVNTLKDMQLVHKDSYGVVSFTEQGQKLAEQYSGYFRTISGLFEALLPDSSDVRSAACALLSEIGPDHLNEMCKRIVQRKTETDPAPQVTCNYEWRDLT